MSDLQKISDVDSADHLCANCDGQGWVCENHPEVPWHDGEGCCGGAGSPCVCNSLHPDNNPQEGTIRKQIK